ncbi:MAG: O-antigen/teichoic acid export membrane protein [Flavobacteriales bacterium]|jgi:O-antigen/teichoic acid export membrane protein
MFSASLSGIMIQLIFSPILSRIYTPEVYGLFSIFNSMTVVAGVFATLGYNKAFVLPKEDSIFRSLLRFSLQGTWLVSLLVFVVTLIIGEDLNKWFGSDDLGFWILLLGPTVMLLSLDRIVLDWAIRVKSFKKQSLVSVPITLGTKTFNALYGWLVSSTVEGLIFTTIILYFSRIIVYLARIIPGAFTFLKKLPGLEIRARAKKEYREYPRYIMWGTAISTFSNYLPILVMPILLGSAKPAGLLVYAGLILDLPARLMGSAISPVFLQKASEIHRKDPVQLGPTTWRLYRTLVLLSVFPLVILFVVGQPLYGFLFGSEWAEAGQAAEILSVYFLYRLVGSPISSIFNVLRKERQFFFFQIGLFVLKLSALLVGGIFAADFLELVMIFAFTNGIAYIALIIWVFALLKYKVWQSIAFTVGIHALLLFIAWYIKSAIF